MHTGLSHLSVDWPVGQSDCLPTYLRINLFSCLKLEMGMVNLIIQFQNYQLWPVLFGLFTL